MIRAAEHATPDHLSDELVPVLAAVASEYRELVFFDQTDREGVYLKARAWALRQEHVTGDPREVDLFLSILGEPLDDARDDTPSHLRDAHKRDYALVALQYAVLAGEAHWRRFPEFERIALGHVDSSHRLHALMMLYLLDEQDGLTDSGIAALDAWRNKPAYRNRLPRFAANLKHDFFRAGR